MKKSELVDALMKFIVNEDLGDDEEEDDTPNFTQLTPDKILALMLEKIMRAEKKEMLELTSTDEHLSDDSLVLSMKVSPEKVIFTLEKHEACENCVRSSKE